MCDIDEFVCDNHIIMEWLPSSNHNESDNFS